ncbi:Sas10/Utp3/C1D family, partial [Rhizoctonia solani]
MTDHLSETVDDLVSSIDELEDVLAPLLAVPLSDLNKQLSSPLDRAKLQVWLSYVLNDLVWIQLRAKGFNPNNLGGGETHDVVPELDRVKSYFAKIKEAENPAKRTLAVDGKVANRFIKHALSSAISQENFSKPTHTRFDESDNVTVEAPAAGPSKTEVEVSNESSSSDEEPAAGTWKAKKRDREVALAANKVNQDSSDDEDEPMEGWEEPEMISSKIVSGDGPNSSNELLGRQKRPKIDPFAGYDGTPSKASKPGTVIPPSEPELRAEHSAGEDSDTSSPSPSVGSAASTSTSTSGQKKTRRTRRGGRRGRDNKRQNLAREALERAAVKK